MSMLDVFNGDAFNTISLTAAINKLPFKPSRIGEMGLFTKKGITTTTAIVDERDGKLMLIPTQARGTMPNAHSGPSRRARSFVVPHLPLNDAVMADDVQGVRKFGSENQVDAVASQVNDKMASMRASHEVTHEYHRIGAIQGLILDADGITEIYDLFAEFGLTETVVSFDFDDVDMEVKLKALEVIRAIEDSLGATPYRNIHAYCGNDFFDALITHASVKDAYDRWNNGQFFREQQNGKGGFEFSGITWENYRGSIGEINFIPTGVARFFPVGVPELFQHIMAPANFIEAVNTVGKEVYAKQERMKFDTGIELHTQSNALMMANRPQCLIKGVTSSSSSSSSASA